MAVTDRLPVVIGGGSATSRFADRVVESEALRLSLEVHRHAIDSDVIDGRVMNNLRRGCGTSSTTTRSRRAGPSWAASPTPRGPS